MGSPVTLQFNLLLLFISMFIILNATLSCSAKPSKIPGHLRKLGSHREAQGVPWTGKFSSPFVFYTNFVDPGKPIIMKEALQHADHPGLLNWTDGFLSEKFGTTKVKVEQSKIENRASTAEWIPLKDFLNIYQKKDVYLVHSLNDKMEDLVLVPSTLQCGGFQKVIQEGVLWMGSHTTSSVLHKDPLDNLLCVVNGRKDIVLIDKAYKDKVESNGFDKEGGFSKVDPKRVDFNKFPRLAEVNWREVTLGKGDCLFIPQGWYHQVTSSGIRHVSVNLWFSRLYWFNTSHCFEEVSIYKPLEPVSTFGFASPNEVHRSQLLSHFRNQGILSRYLFHELLPTKPTEERANEFFNAINFFPDGALSWSELYLFDIDKILPQFWDLFNVDSNNKMNRKKEDLESDEDVELASNNVHNQNSKDGSSVFIDDDDSWKKTIQSDVASDSAINGPSIDGDDDGHEEVRSLPLPDYVSGDTPSLPDDSVDSHDQLSSPNSESLYMGHVDVNTDNKDEFCYDESDCSKERKEALNHFTESSNSDSHNDEDTGLDSSDEVHKVIKDEL